MKPAVRDMAYDGTYFYGAAASTSLYEMDFIGQSGTLISTLTAAVATRACAYDAEYDGFWGNNWSDPITLYDRSGNILNQFNCGAYSSYYGFASLNDAGTPWLYGFAQAGGASQAVIVQIDPSTGAETGVAFDAIGYSTTGTGIAGGLAEFNTYAPGYWTLLGIIQNETVFGLEVGFAPGPPTLDLALKEILEPNTGFALGIEYIVIKVKNQGTLTQSNFDVKYRVDGGVYVTETISGPLTIGESIIYTFNQTYDFSTFGEYFIETEVILEGDENPDNNSKDKTITNWDTEQWCNYSITMWDDYGDGWNGGYVQIFGDGIEYINATLASGAGPETIEFLVESDAFLTAVWTAGGWPYECSYEIFDAEGNSIFQDGFGGVDPVGGDIGYVSCETFGVDAGVTNIISPETGMLLGVEPVIITVKNYGSQVLPEIPVRFNLDGAGWVEEVVPGPVGPIEEVEYTFSATVDLTEFGTYILDVCTFVPGDEDPVNDCMQAEIENMEGFYCDAWTNTEDEWIAFVDFGLIQNASGWQGGVADYTALFNHIGGVPAEIIVTNGNAWASDKVTVWCDWNDDFIFNNEFGSNEKFVLINDGTGAVFTGDITAPAGALGGPHRMRIRMTYNDDPVPCDESSYGEVEDYSIIVYYGGCPEITWNPNSFSQIVEVGQTAQDFLNIGNIGTISLQWVIEVIFPFSKDSSEICFKEKAVIPWLSVNPLEGMISPQGSDTVTLEFNTGNWPAGTELNANLILYSADPVNPAVYIPVTMTVEGLTEPHFNFEGGDPSSPLWTIYIGNATYSYSYNDLVAGDEIAIFDGDLLVGAFTLNQVCTPSNQFDNDLTAFSVLNTQAGYQAGNEFTFKCWDASEQEESDLFNYEFLNPYGDAYMGYVFPTGDGEYSVIDLDFYFLYHSHNLSYGYQFISSNVNPIIPDMTVVMEDVLNDNLDFVRNSLGQTLRKIGPNWVNGIGDWIVEEGYLVKMFAPDSFSILGAPVNPTTPIPVITGFQFVSYFPYYPVNAMDAFATIIGDDLDFVRNSQGQTLRKIGPNWVNGIGECNPTEGYLVKMFASGEIIYPASAKSNGKTTIQPENFIFDGGNPAEAIYTIYLSGLEIGDEVAAYDGDKMVGVTKINSQNAFENELPVFSTLVKSQGYEEGNLIILKVWSENNIVSADFTMEAIYDAYVSDVYPDEDGKYSIVNITKGTSIVRDEIIVYPNPATDLINIVFSKKIKSVSIFNNVGQTVYSGNETQININNFESGVYIIWINNGNEIISKKILIE